MIRFPCPKCRVTLEAEPAAVIRCPACGQMCRLPASVQEPPRRTEVAARSKSSVHRSADRADRRDEGPSSPPPRSRKRPAPQRSRPDEGVPESEGSSTTWMIPLILMLGLVGLVTGIATLVLFVLHDGGVTAITLGAIMAVLGALWIIGRAAEDGELFPCLFIPGYSVLYTIRNLESVGMAAFVQLVGIVLLSAGIIVYENPELLPPAARNYASAPPEPRDTSILSSPRGEDKDKGKDEENGVANPVVEPGAVGTPQELPWMKREPVSPNSLQGLLAAWTFDEEEGTIAHDAAGIGFNGTVVGGKWVKGIKGNAIELNGKGDFFDYGRSPRFNFPAEGAFTFAAWFRTRARGGDLLDQRNSDDRAPVIRVWVSGGSLHGMVRQDGNDQGQSAEVHGDTVNDGQWHHFALTRDERGEVELFLNGKSQSKKSAPDSGGSITTDLRTVGGQKDTRSTFAGAIDELCIFDRVLALKEIEALTGQ